MPLTTQHWIGIGGATVLLGYLLWPKTAKASPLTPPVPANPPGTPPVYTPPTIMTPYDFKPPTVEVDETAKGRTDGYNDGLAAGVADAKNGVGPGTTVMTLGGGLSASYVAGYSSGWALGYDEGYKTKTTSVITDSKATGYSDVAYKQGYGDGYSDARFQGLKDGKDGSEFGATKPASSPSGRHPSYVDGWKAGNDFGYTEGYNEGKASVSGVGSMRNGAFLPKHWTSLLPRVTSSDYGMWTPPVPTAHPMHKPGIRR